MVATARHQPGRRRSTRRGDVSEYSGGEANCRRVGGPTRGRGARQLGHDPGFHLKLPIADSIEEIEVRRRKNVKELRAATANQLPITASVSINWTANRESAMELFIRFGGLDRFEGPHPRPQAALGGQGGAVEVPG